jgi:hypothetical protein
MTLGETVELLQQLIRNQCVNDGTVGSGQEVRTTDGSSPCFEQATPCNSLGSLMV